MIAKRKSRKILIFILYLIGAMLALYVGGWLMFIKPILAACTMFDAGTLTATIIGITFIKCMFASLIGWAIFAVTHFICLFILGRR